MSLDRYGIKFDLPSAKRLLNAARYVEQQPRGRAPDLAGPVSTLAGTMLVVTTAMNPMTGNAPGTAGRGKIQKLVAGSYSDLSSTVYPIYNDMEKTVGVGAYVLCIPGPGGVFHMVTVDKCANLS